MLLQIHFVLCIIADIILLAGMLLMGFALRNIPKINIAEDIDPTWSSALRLASVVCVSGFYPYTCRVTN